MDFTFAIELNGFVRRYSAKLLTSAVPHKICQFVYELSNDLNRFYHDNRILSEPDLTRQHSWIKLLFLARELLVTCLDLLGIQVPERM